VRLGKCQAAPQINTGESTMKKIYSVILIGYLLINIDIQAQTSYEKWIGGPYSGDVASKIIPASDGGFIIVGAWTVDYGQSWDTETDAAIIKIDETGSIVWRTMIPTVARYTSADLFKGVAPASDGGYLAVGVIQTANDVGKEDVLIAKFNTNGDTVWTRRYDIAAYDCANAVVPAGDEGYIIAGRCGPLGDDNILLLKINSSGDTLWTRKWGGTLADKINDVISSGDGNFYAVGCIQNQSTYVLSDYIIKLSTTGDTLWTKRITGGEAISVRPTADGGYIIAEKQAIVKVDADFIETWRKNVSTFLGMMGGNVRCAIPITGGGYVAAGKSDEMSPSFNQQLFVARFNATGDSIWVKRFGEGTNYKQDEAFSVIEASDGGFLSVGFTNRGSSMDIYLVKVTSDGLTAIENQNGISPISFILEQNYPNPFNPATTIKYSIPQVSHVNISVYDLIGREVAILVNETQSAGSHQMTFKAQNLSSGIYFYKLTAGRITHIKKMTLIK